MSSREADILFIGPLTPSSEPWQEGDAVRIRSCQYQPDLDSAISYLKGRKESFIVDAASLLECAAEWERHLETQLDQSLQMDDWIGERLRLVSLALREAQSHLALVRACSDALEARAGDSPSAGNIVNQISRALKRLECILTEIGWLAEHEIPHPRLKLAQVAFSEEIGQIVRACKVQASQKGLSFRAAYWEPVPHLVWIDAERLRHLMGDLISIAIAAASEGEVLLEVAHVGEKLELTITTSEPAPPFGIEARGKVTVPGSELESYRVRIAIARRMAQWMGGDLSPVRSRNDKRNGIFLTLKAELSTVDHG